ncbi:ABC transporter ATP-binding protein [Pseudomonadota bacterium]
MSDDVMVKVEGLSKKFCRSLKRSLWYGVQDVSGEMLGRKGHHDRLRKNEFWAVKDVSFELKRGECLGLIGPNGAGKSTLLKILNGLVKPDKGRVTIKGRVGALIELGAGFNPILTGRENIYINGSVLGFSKKEIDHKFDSIVDFSGIEQFVDTPVQSYSSGMSVRLGFAIAAQMEPDVLLIDEVFAVGDMGFVSKCINRIGKLMQSSAVIFVSHSMPNISRLCSSVMTLHKGEISYLGTEPAKGIEALFSFFEASRTTETFNSLNTSIDNIKIDSKDRRDVTELIHSDEFVLHIYCRVAPEFQEFCVNMLIFDRNQNPVVYSSSHQAASKLLNSNDENHITVDLGRLNLDAGTYTIDISITDMENVRVLAQTQAMGQFRVKSNHLGYAPIRVGGKWSF